MILRQHFLYQFIKSTNIPSSVKKIIIIFFDSKEVEETKQTHFGESLQFSNKLSMRIFLQTLHFGHLKHFPNIYCVYEFSVISRLQILQERFVQISPLVLKYSVNARSFLPKS